MNTIIALVALPFFMQSAAATICPVNQYLAHGVNVCYEIRPSLQNPSKMDSRLVDLVSAQYLRTKWLNTDTMLSKVETATTTYCWYNDASADTFPCR